MSQKTDRLIEVADESTNIIMDYLRDTHGIDPDTDLDDMLYTNVHKYIKRILYQLKDYAQES
jgi:hypothetical protein